MVFKLSPRLLIILKFVSISLKSFSRYEGINERSFDEVYETNEQYVHREGQKGMEMYKLQSFEEGVPVILFSLRATSIAREAFLGITR